MIKSVGIDLAGIGEHKVRCLDERAQMCDGFRFETTTAGLTKIEERVFKSGVNPIIVFEPTGLAWQLCGALSRILGRALGCPLQASHFLWIAGLK